MLDSISAAALVGGKILHETFKMEPVHAVFPLDAEITVKERFARDGARDLGLFQEFKQARQRWGMAFKIGSEQELHVRAHDQGPGTFSLSAHLEFGRDTIKHVTAQGNYTDGGKLLAAYLEDTGLHGRRCA